MGLPARGPIGTLAQLAARLVVQEMREREMTEQLGRGHERLKKTEKESPK
jgi:hypothetical protein